MPTRISLRRVEEPPRASSWPYPVRWPNFSRMRRRLENAPLLVGLKPRSKCSNQSFGRGASSYLCAVPRPTDQPLTTLSASKHDRPTDQRAVVGDFGWQLTSPPNNSFSGGRFFCVANPVSLPWVGMETPVSAPRSGAAPKFCLCSREMGPFGSTLCERAIRDCRGTGT